MDINQSINQSILMSLELYNVYNSIIVIDQSGKILDKYNKIRLVPFGEHFPFRNLFPFLRTIVGETDFSAGLENKIFKF